MTTPALLAVAASAARLCMATVDHLWRIAFLRPAFNRLADSMGTVMTFNLAYLAAGQLRWGILGEMSFGQVLAGNCLQLLACLIAFERKDRNSSMVAAALGCSCVVDVAASFAFATGIAPSVSGWQYTAIEAAYIFATYLRFKQLPAAVKQRGYLRNRGTQGQAD